ncbi:DUF485 domain-containing protein [Neisseria sp. ZJ106]|uniref:DUF485 domain-containing protein n=1 Tax=Neisseria lisongii TaxID=2912188 RepID=A0AAW5AKB6_9NEIS|nr:DUF485 domain-containing protein [Neisseria lisongii]MCF7520800.1 DUF485 domain-containing protein [Neisseria lisongii]MCF7528905.1 DUF485 domain-containing protein [Neisseria lisongii]WCL70737.1 DUF485 domain-containing protein [Neisseria lisongii]
MDQQTLRNILHHREFQKMARQKALLGWGFSAVIFFMYVVYIWIIGSSPELLKIPVSPEGITTWGIYAGIFVIVFSFITTGIYVKIANGKFDKMTQDVVQAVQENHHE